MLGCPREEEEHRLTLLRLLQSLRARTMSSTPNPSAPPLKKGRKPEAMADSAQTANEELRIKLTDIQIELQQERSEEHTSELQSR